MTTYAKLSHRWILDLEKIVFGDDVMNFNKFGGFALIDSGESFIRWPADLYYDFLENLKKYSDKVSLSSSGLILIGEECDIIRPKLPALTFILGSHSYTLEAQYYTINVDQTCRVLFSKRQSYPAPAGSPSYITLG